MSIVARAPAVQNRRCERPVAVQDLYDALTEVVRQIENFETVVVAANTCWERYGPPRWHDLTFSRKTKLYGPNPEEEWQKRARGTRFALDNQYYGPPTEWASIVPVCIRVIRKFRRSVSIAIDATKSAASITDLDHLSPDQRFSFRLRVRLRRLHALATQQATDDSGLTHLINAPPERPVDWVATCMAIEDARLFLFEYSPATKSKPDGWSLSELAREADVSRQTIRDMVKEAGVRGPKNGDHGHRFSRSDIERLIEVGNAAAGRPKWKQAAQRLPRLIA